MSYTRCCPFKHDDEESLIHTYVSVSYCLDHGQGKKPAGKPLAIRNERIIPGNLQRAGNVHMRFRLGLNWMLVTNENTDAPIYVGCL